MSGSETLQAYEWEAWNLKPKGFPLLPQSLSVLLEIPVLFWEPKRAWERGLNSFSPLLWTWSTICSNTQWHLNCNCCAGPQNTIIYCSAAAMCMCRYQAVAKQDPQPSLLMSHVAKQYFCWRWYWFQPSLLMFHVAQQFSLLNMTGYVADWAFFSPSILMHFVPFWALLS
jgi:hypothetical protein